MLSAAALIAGFNVSKRAWGGIIPRSSINTALTTPAGPLDPSRWPIFAFIEPLVSGKLVIKDTVRCERRCGQLIQTRIGVRQGSALFRTLFQ